MPQISVAGDIPFYEKPHTAQIAKYEAFSSTKKKPTESRIKTSLDKNKVCKDYSPGKYLYRV